MGALAARGIGLLLAGLALASLTFPAAAQEEPPRSLPEGPLYVPSDNLTVSEGETLAIGPRTSLLGPGGVHVWGHLIVKGEPGATTNFSVPLLVLGNGSVTMEHARLWGVNATALEVRGGRVQLDHVLFEGNTRAVLVGGSAQLVARDVAFRDHPGEAVYVEEAADVELDRATFTGNGRGITVYSASRFALLDSEFAANGQHLVIDLGPWSAPGEVELARDRFGPTSATPAQLPGILLRHDPPLVGEGAERSIRMDSNRIEGAPVGVRAEGRGLVVESTNDTLVDNAIGWSVQLATLRVTRGTFGNDRDVDGSGRVHLDSVTYLRAGTPPFVPDEAEAAWLPWALGAAVLLLGVAAFLVPRLARRARVPSPARHHPSSLDPSPSPAPPRPSPVEVTVARPVVDLGTPITSVERRILEDILAHPGTAQRAVADRLGTTRQALHYHVKKLEARGLVLKSVEGRETRCTVPAAVASMLAAPGTRTESQEKG